MMVGASVAAEGGPEKPLGSDIIPVERLGDWRAGVTVGVPEGIPADRANLIDVTKEPYKADNTGATDTQPAIMKAIADAKDKDVIYLPAGTYRVESPIQVRQTKRLTIRGAGPDKTVIMSYSKWGSGISVGWDSDWRWNKPDYAVTENPKRGATVLTVGDTSALDEYPNGGIGQICQIRLKNDDKLPVIAPAQWEYLRRQTSRVVAKTKTTVTISPAILFDLPENLEPKLSVATRQTEFTGVEDLKIDGTNGTIGSGIYLEQGYACWVKNVEVTEVTGFHFNVRDSLRGEIRHCYAAKRKGAGSNGAALLVNGISGFLVEDNMLAQQFPHIEVNSSSSGNVFAYNYCYDSSIWGLIGASIDSNHRAHNSFNLYEGNVSPKFQNDGYHGSGSNDTVFRNWFHGTSPGTERFGICVNLNRFTRYYNIVGNVLGCKGYTWIYDNCNEDFRGFGYEQHFIYMLGMPNMGNGAFNGKTVQPSKGITWADWERYSASEPGKGPGPGGFQELDLDVAATTLRLGNYNYKDNGVPASESLKGKKLPTSLYLEKKPEWFGKLAWPPFGPDTDFEKNKIPAQERYEEMTKGEK